MIMSIWVDFYGNKPTRQSVQEADGTMIANINIHYFIETEFCDLFKAAEVLYERD